MQPLIITLTGPSCAGKSTLEGMLKNAGFEAAISTTTREPRPGEVDGQNYYFVNKTRFAALYESGGLVESVEFGGNFYGLTRAEIERIAATGKPVVAVVEPEGREQIIEYCMKNEWNCECVYVGNPPEVIAKRFMDRALMELHESPIKAAAALSKRLGTMLGVEQKWISEAQQDLRVNPNFRTYNILLQCFDESNSAYVVEKIVELAQGYGYLAAGQKAA